MDTVLGYLSTPNFPSAVFKGLGPLLIRVAALKEKDIQRKTLDIFQKSILTPVDFLGIMASSFFGGILNVN